MTVARALKALDAAKDDQAKNPGGGWRVWSDDAIRDHIASFLKREFATQEQRND